MEDSCEHPKGMNATQLHVLQDHHRLLMDHHQALMDHHFLVQERYQAAFDASSPWIPDREQATQEFHEALQEHHRMVQEHHHLLQEHYQLMGKTPSNATPL